MGEVITMGKKKRYTQILNDLEECSELLLQVNDHLGKYPQFRKQYDKVHKLQQKLMKKMDKYQ